MQENNKDPLKELRDNWDDHMEEEQKIDEFINSAVIICVINIVVVLVVGSVVYFLLR